MPPALALLLGFGLIAVLIIWIKRLQPEVSGAVWIPFLWMFFIGTRFPSLWLDPGGIGRGDEFLEGSSTDQIVFLALYAAALVVLFRRRVSVAALMSANIWVSVFLLYCLLSVAWSDFPWTALKRFIKVMEHIVMVLVILTETHPARALDALLRRFLLVTVVLSVVLLKYFPEFSRGFDQWTGEAFNMGVTADKNALGHICILGAAFFASSLFYAPHRNLGAQRRGQVLIDVSMLAAIAWLLGIANAKTALVCALLGFGTVLLLARTGLRHSPKAALFTILSLAGLVAGLEATFGIREWVIEVLDRDPTLTDRTFLWADVLGIPNNMLLGAGFESFWLGERLDLLWDRYWWHPNQAHNGYIETYINLGIIGVMLMVTMIIASQLRALTLTSIGEAFGPFRFAVLLAIAVLNYTDATFKAVHILYFVFFLVSISLVHVSASSSALVEPVDSGFGEAPTRPEHAT